MQKERIKSEDLFVQDITGKDLALPPAEKQLTKSQCTPLFMCAYTARNAGAVIHTHSIKAVMVTMLWPGKEFRIKNFEMIKGKKSKNHSQKTRLLNIRWEFIRLGKYELQSDYLLFYTNFYTSQICGFDHFRDSKSGDRKSVQI